MDIQSQPEGPDAGQRLLRRERPVAGGARSNERRCRRHFAESQMRSERLFNPWVVALTVTLSTFMEVLDTSIANLSLPHIAGSMAASYDEATWVLTSYLVANAVILPLSGWLTGLLGRKRFNMTCVAIFTLSSVLCGMATSLPMLIFFRILQGIGGGGFSLRFRRFCSIHFPRPSAEWPWPSMPSRFWSRRFLALRWADGSPTVIPGDGFFTSTFRSGLSR